MCGKYFKDYDFNHIMRLGIRLHNISLLEGQLIHDRTLRKICHKAVLTLKQIQLLALEERNAELERINFEVQDEMRSLYNLQKRMAIEKEIKIALEKEAVKQQIKKSQEVWTKKN